MKLYVYKCETATHRDNVTLEELSLKAVEVKETPKMFISNDYIIDYSRKIIKGSLDRIIKKWGELYIISFNNNINYFKELLNNYYDESINILNNELSKFLKCKDLMNKGETLLIGEEVNNEH